MALVPPQNAQAECGETEPWYGTKFSVAAIPPAWLDAWRAGPAPAGLHLPAPNPFIPTAFELISESSPAPEVVHKTEMVRLWHRADPSFGVPKACVYLHLQLPGERKRGIPLFKWSV